jgi:tRNA A-37 threonylcarbamoyl transferase component Bud32
VRRFEDAHARGQRPDLESFLPADPQQRRIALRELIHADLELRLRAGEAVRVEHCLERFPELAGERQAVLELLCSEVRFRAGGGVVPSLEEYRRRFPALADELIRTLDTLHDPGARTPPPVAERSERAPAATHRTELPQVPGYEIEAELGRGGMGVVYKAKNTLMGRVEALKVMQKELLDDAATMARFLREIRAAAQLNHPNIVTAYAALQLGDLLVLAMEYVEGEDLARVVCARGPLPVVNACHYVRQAALGLQHAFEKGMVHRDVKPENLILARDGKKHVVKALDFGLAKATRAQEVSFRQRTTGDGKLTTEGAMLGTANFIAPEQILDAAHADVRADVYSLGCTLYFLLAGRPPFQEKDVDDLLQAHCTREAKRLDEVRKEVPAELAAVVARMMAKDPAQRYRQPVEVVEALAPFVAVKLQPLPPAPAAAPEAEVGVTAAVAASSPEEGNDRPSGGAEPGLMGSLGLHVQPDGFLPPLNGEEIALLWKLGGTADEMLRRRFVEEALRFPGTRRRLRYRADYAFQAVVGLDLCRREVVEGMLVERLSGKEVSLAEGSNLALCLASLGMVRPQTARQAAALLARATSHAANPRALQALTRGLAALTARLNASEAAATCARAAATLVQAMSTTAHPFALPELAKGVASLAAPLDAGEAAATCARAAATLVQAMSTTANPFALQVLAKGLGAVAARLDAGEAKAAAAILTWALSTADAPEALQALARGVAALAARLDASEAKAILLGAMSKTAIPNALLPLAEGLASRAARLDAREAKEATAILTRALSKTADPYALFPLAEGLVAVAARLDAEQAAAACARTAAILIQATTKTADPSRLQALARGLRAVVGDRRLQRFRSAPASIGLMSFPPSLPFALAVSTPTLEPAAEPLSVAALVELLKHPLCVGLARRTVLDALETRCQRTFADQWDFVRFATEQQLGLDLSSPPRPPGE